MPDFGSLLVPGKPVLPSRIFSIAIPPGAELRGVGFDVSRRVTLPGAYRIPPASLPRVIGPEDPLVYAQAQRTYQRDFDSVYASDDPYPRETVGLVRKAAYRTYNLVDVRVAPFSYRPVSGELTYHTGITIHVRCALPSGIVEKSSAGPPRIRKIAEELIVNFDQTADWHLDRDRDVRGLYDYVIITLDSLTSSVAQLVAWETSKGRNVTVVTTSWIDSTFAGYDLAERIRNFLRDKYPASEWGIEDVFLVGHDDDLPMRRAGIDVGHGIPATDFYYAELSLPDAQSWDSDGDRRYGEASDTFDLYSEVNVGRIPSSDPATVQAICERSVAYEQNDDPAFKKNMLLLGAHFWLDTDTAALMEAKVDQLWMTDWTFTRLYESFSSYSYDYELTHANVMAVWPAGHYAFVNWGGHGLPSAAHTVDLVAFIRSSDCPSLNGDFPAVIFADSCNTADPDYYNLGQAMLEHAAVGYVGATSTAYGCNQWDSAYDGCSQSLDYLFTTAVTSGEYTQGEALQWALREMYIRGLWYDVKYEMLEWVGLLGNPNLRVAPQPALKILLPDGAPEILAPNVSTVFTVEIVSGSEAYTPGTGLLHYRYDGGAFATSPLVPVSGDIFDATLPGAGCSAVPEFYVSAQGDGGSTIVEPADATDSVYTADVGSFRTVMQEPLDTDPGWSTEAGWAFGQPTGGGGEYGAPDPTSGYTGDNVYGYNLNGDYPNNLSETHLTSPAFDCTGLSNVHLTFWRWLGVEGKAYDRAYVRVSTDGSQWTTVWANDGLTLDYAWTYVDLDISAIAHNEPTVYLRWTMGTSDSAWRCCGWNIDDIELSVFECTLEATCYDGLLNQEEDRIDCGGSCLPCDCTSDGACDDGDVCTGIDTCDAFGTCVQTVLTDCNANGIEDACDMDPTDPDGDGSVSDDLDENGIPDECECFESSTPEPDCLALPGSPASRKVRYLSFTAGDAGRSQAVRIRFANLPAPYAHWGGVRLWVQEPQRHCENCGQTVVPQPENPPDYGCGGSGGIQPPWYWVADLGCEPFWTEWWPYDVVHVSHEGIIPEGAYEIQALDDTCWLTIEGSYSSALSAMPSPWADAVSDCTTFPCGPPDGVTGIVDVTAVLDKFKNLPGNIQEVRADIEGSPAGDHRVPDRYIGITDVTYCLGAFLGDTYPGPGFPPPSDPPSCP